MVQEQVKHTWECLKSQLLNAVQMLLIWNTGSCSAHSVFQKYIKH